MAPGSAEGAIADVLALKHPVQEKSFCKGFELLFAVVKKAPKRVLPVSSGPSNWVALKYDIDIWKSRKKSPRVAVLSITRVVPKSSVSSVPVVLTLQTLFWFIRLPFPSNRSAWPLLAPLG